MPENLPTKSKCVHTIVIDNWRPDLCAVTLPNLERFAKRIGADFNIISKAKFPGYPPNYERLQIWESGRDYQWNINIDADTILHKDFEDPTTTFDPRGVGCMWMTDAKYYFQWDKYFERNGRNIGMADSFVVSSWMTHDIWQPLEMTFEEAKKCVFRDERMVSEYCLSRNVAKFGLKWFPAVKDHSKHYSIMVTTHKITNPVDMMVAKMIEWNDTELLSKSFLDAFKARNVPHAQAL